MVQSDGKVVFCAAKGIMRVTPTGALDTSFGNGGVIKPSVAAQCADLVGLADGKLFAIFKPKVDNNPSVNVVFARFTSGGQPDASYGNGGAREVLTPVTGLGALSPIMGRRVVLATDGSFVLADMDVFAGGLARPLSAKRYDSVGDPVASYVTNGPAAFRANHAALLPDGRMVVVGYHDGSNTGSVLRLDANGALDATFGAGGEVVLVDLFARFVLAQPDGKLLIAAEIGGASFSPQGLRVARLLSDGTLDATFGTGGVAQATTGDGSATVVAVDGSGRIVVAGALGTNGPINSAKLGVARFTANGQIDATFGSGGKSQPLDLPMVNEYPVTMSFDGLGRIVLGIRATGVPDHGLIFRLWP